MWMFCVLQVWLSLTKPHLASRLASRLASCLPSTVLFPPHHPVRCESSSLLVVLCAALWVLPVYSSRLPPLALCGATCRAKQTTPYLCLLWTAHITQDSFPLCSDRVHTLPCAASANPEAASGRKIWPFCCKPKCIFISKYPQIPLSWVKLDPHSVREEKKTTKQPEVKALCFWTNKR